MTVRTHHYTATKKMLIFLANEFMQEFEEAKVKEIKQLKEEIEENSKMFFFI